MSGAMPAAVDSCLKSANSVVIFFAKENLYFVQRGEEDLEVTESSKSIIWGIVPVM